MLTQVILEIGAEGSQVGGEGRGEEFKWDSDFISLSLMRMISFNLSRKRLRLVSLFLGGGDFVRFSLFSFVFCR